MWKPNFKFGYAFGIFYISAFLVAAILFPSSWGWWCLAALTHFLIFTFGVSFGLHKAAAHQMAPNEHWLVRAAVLTGVLANAGSPIDFILTHGLHHRFADQPGDPQNSARLGWRLLFGLRTADTGQEPLVEVYARREVLRSRYYAWIHNNYYLILAGSFAASFALGGLPGLLFIAIIPSGTAFFALGTLNYLGHGRGGYRNFSGNDAKNVAWLFPLLLGENWHNNHHAAPSQRNYRRRFWELDPSSFYFWLVGGEEPR